jgi:hypothetical protein
VIQNKINKKNKNTLLINQKKEEKKEENKSKDSPYIPVNSI